MNVWLRSRVTRFGRVLRRYFDRPYGARPPGEQIMGSVRHEIRDKDLAAATDDMLHSADHAKKVAQAVSRATNPDDPDSFESKVRKLLRGIQ